MVLWRLSMGVTLLVIMKTITVLLCALANQVTSQSNDSVTDIFPARILARQKTLRENSDLYVTCSTLVAKRHRMVYVYLCKDGHGIKRQMQKQDQDDSTFTISSVGLHHSGSYSCVYSIKLYLPSKVAKRGSNIIQILVIANFLPADISLAGPSTVMEGDSAELRCTVSDTLQTLDACQLVHSYLVRNESILQVQAFNVTRKEATFTIDGAVPRDSGDYSCVVLPSKCIQEHEKTLYGKNTVSLKVKGSLLLHVIVSCEVTTLMLLVLCLWWIKKRDLCNPCTVSQQTNTVMLEEQQEQPEADDLEAQDEDSFSTEAEQEYHNVVAAEDLTYSDDSEGAYNVVDEGENDYDDLI